MGINISQGDKILITLRAPDQNLASASFATRFKKTDDSDLEIPNGQHTANPDQTTYKGYFTIALTASDTLQLKVGSGSNFVTKITQTDTILQYHGTITIRESPFNE